MKMLSPKDLAEMINKDCDNFRYFWAYGLIKETVKFWETGSNADLLCPTAQIMLSQVQGR